jgi:uncharacterized SAM-binding protein YcdF (DUF218 family)
VKRLASFAAIVALVGLGWASWAAWRESETDNARHADAIVVLGAAEYRGKPSPVLRARLDHALDLYRRGFAPKILTTGGSGENSRFTEAETARDYLVKNGVPAENVLFEAEGTSTHQSVAAAAEILRRLGASTCIVVTDGYHVFRVRKMFEDRGILAFGSPRYGAPKSVWTYAREAAGYWVWALHLSR